MRAAIALMLMMTGVVQAHGLHVTAAADHGSATIIATFDDGSAIANAAVTIHDAQGAIVATGMTDTAGRFVAENLAEGSYSVRVDAGDSHRIRVAFTVGTTSIATNAASTLQVHGMPWLVGAGVIIGIIALRSRTRNQSTSPMTAARRQSSQYSAASR
jgi:hypothetical protein